MYVIKNFEGKYWKRCHKWTDNIQSASVYDHYPTLAMNKIKEKCYAVKVRIEIIDEPIEEKKARKKLIESYNKYWSRLL